MDHVWGLDEVDRTQVGLVGGKAAHLGELKRVDGVQVPDGFCVTTDAFRMIMDAAPGIEALLDQLSGLQLPDSDAIRALSAEIRRVVEEVRVPDDLAQMIITAVAGLGGRAAYAVRSSATAEDLPGASFAGQQDSYLDVAGSAVLEHVRRCWASLFTERAVTYRISNGFDHRRVQMAVVVQQMILPDAAGVLFTADPVTGDRTTASVEAVAGLGEDLVSGLVTADLYAVRADAVVARTVVAEQQPVLTDAQVVSLVRLGRRVEAHLGQPQDIEWCLVGDELWVVQSRPITTLFPVPPVTDDAHHVYLSVGHQQMMTDPMRPLGLSVWQLTTPRPMAEAGGRLFVDVTAALATRAARAGLLDMMGRSDPLMRDALQTVLDGDRLPPLPAAGPAAPPPAEAAAPLEADPALVPALVERAEASLAVARRGIADLTGSALLDFILDDVVELRRILHDPQGRRVFMSAIEAAEWLNDRLERWLGEKNAADALARSVPHNVTSEMGLALLDVADAIRPHPEVVAFLRGVADDGVVDEHWRDDLTGLRGGLAARDALERWLATYGMRGVGEIDITRPRWIERPSLLVPVILGHVTHAEPGAGAARFEQGRREARAKEQELLERVRALPDGERLVEETRRRIDRVRTFMGYREYPKYGMVSRYLVYKQALLAEAERLVRAGVLHASDDIFYLRLDELHEVVRTQEADHDLIRRRRDEFRSYHAFSPPRVLTSDGEAVAGTYRRADLPSGALAGLAVSAGTVAGRARVVLDPAQADLEPGDILVTAYTDPSWTPLFVGIVGLVTEVGGLMTHGSVVAREYGLPAVVGVQSATRLIRDGQRIRVHGTEGYVEIVA